MDSTDYLEPADPVCMVRTFLLILTVLGISNIINVYRIFQKGLIHFFLFIFFSCNKTKEMH